MTPYPATLEANLLSFAHSLRAADLLVSPQEVALAHSALAAVDLGDRDEVRLALRSLFATSPAEQRLFERLFEHYWRGGLLDDTDPAPRQNPPPKPPRLQSVSLLDWQAGEGSDETVDTQAYSAAEVVAQGDAAVQTSEVEVLSKLVRRLVKRLATRPSRRWTVASKRGGRVDLRRTLRRSLAFGGVPVELRYRTRATGKTRVVFVFDVSGSMMVHSGLLLQLAYAFVRERRLSRTQVFGFSTELYPLTEHLQRGGVAEALRAARLAMPGRSGGTKIGASLATLLGALRPTLGRQNDFDHQQRRLGHRRAGRVGAGDARLERAHPAHRLAQPARGEPRFRAHRQRDAYRLAFCGRVRALAQLEQFGGARAAAEQVVTPVSTVSAVILAGGESRRMGGPKLALELEGRTLLARAVETALQVCPQVLVVVGAYAELYTPLAEAVGARVVVNPNWREGLASSLRVGVASLPPQTAAVLVLLGDQPLVPVAHFEKMLSLYRSTDATLLFSQYDGVRGAPTLIDASLFGAVQTLTGDTGARALQDLARVAAVPLAASFDVDTPADAVRLRLTLGSC